MRRVEGVLYVSGAPREWVGWLAPGDVVTLEVGLDGIDVSSQRGRGQLTWDQMTAIHVEPPQEAEALHATRWPLASINAKLLTSLPRRPYERFVLTLPSGPVEFDVRDRHWAEEELLETEEAHALALTDRLVVHIRDYSYRWVNVKTFRPDGASWHTPSEALRMLMANPDYWDGYIGGSITPGIHGPYRLEALNDGCFERVEVDTALFLLDSWLNNLGPLRPEQIDGDLSAVTRLITDAVHRFQLPELGDEAENEIGWILDRPFFELVLLGPEDRVDLVVASGD